MKAIIKVVNPARGMFAAEIEGGGEYVIFELLDTSELESGDIIEHTNFYSMGGETFTNITQGCLFEVYVEDVCGASMVKERCFL